MIDLYAFPQGDDSPYTCHIQAISDPYAKIAALERAISSDINHPRFIPYIQLHEFETFLLVNPDKLITMYPERQTHITKLKTEIRNINPEEINESNETAPSKRIIKHIPAYASQKAQVGPLVAEEIGLDLLREKCPHFDEWLTKLENIPEAPQ